MIVVIEDLQISKKLIENILNELKLEYISFDNIEEPIEYLKNNKIKLLISDFNLGENNLLYLLKEIKKDFKIIVVSGNLKPEIIQELYKYSIDSYVNKPFDKNKIKMIILKEMQ